MNDGSLARRVVVLAGGLLVGALVVTGLATGALVYAQAGAALDRELLAAGHAYTSGDGTPWEVEYSSTPVRVWTSGPGDARVPASAVARALHDRRPQWLDLDGDRVLLLVTERESLPTEDAEEHRLVAVAAPRATLAAAVARFVLPYTATAAVVVLLAVAGLGRLAALALAPLTRAREAALSATAEGAHTRLPEGGPEEVRGLLVAMNALLARLDAAAAAQARFTSEAAHELRTPVTVLIGELDVALRKERDAASLRETVVSAREEAGRLAALVEGLLTLARVDSGQAEAGREPVRMSEIAADAARRERSTLTTAGCVLTLDVRSDAETFGNRALLVTAVANLLRNAAVHAPGAPVRLVVDGARFVVQDGGAGIPEADRAAVFDRLARGATARRRDRGGLGLGLPLAREIARRHGGDCTIGAAVDGGCRVELTVGGGG